VFVSLPKLPHPSTKPSMAKQLRANPGLRPRPGAESAEDLFQRRLDQVAAETETLLDRLLATEPAEGEIGRPTRLLEAMRYACLGGGKRFRPFLVVESAALFGVPRERALMAAAALECVHCYSLVHDDLPARSRLK
jgi:geranylgeranyl pyrophosphate synthase